MSFAFQNRVFESAKKYSMEELLEQKSRGTR